MLLPSQVVGQKVFIFKMLINGVGSGANLVMRMQLGGDLENAWIMFDHVKYVASWKLWFVMCTTMLIVK